MPSGRFIPGPSVHLRFIAAARRAPRGAAVGRGAIARAARTRPAEGPRPRHRPPRARRSRVPVGPPALRGRGERAPPSPSIRGTGDPPVTDRRGAQATGSQGDLSTPPPRVKSQYSSSRAVRAPPSGRGAAGARLVSPSPELGQGGWGVRARGRRTHGARLEVGCVRYHSGRLGRTRVFARRLRAECARSTPPAPMALSRAPSGRSGGDVGGEGGILAPERQRRPPFAALGSCRGGPSRPRRSRAVGHRATDGN